MVNNNLYEKGQSIVEILIAIGIVAIIIGSVVTTYVASLRANANARLSAIGLQLAEETYDNLRALTEANWHTIYAMPKATHHHLTLVNNIFNVGLGTETIMAQGVQYTRSFTVENAQRDVNGNIVDTGGINDPSTQRIVVTTSWPVAGETGTVKIEGFFARNRNISSRTTNWTDGPLQTGPFIGETSGFAVHDNIDFITIPGTIKLLNF